MLGSILGDSIQRERCFCEAPGMLGRAELYCYESDRLDKFICWREGMATSSEGVPPLGYRCTDLNDRSTCVPVPDVYKAGLTHPDL